MTKDMKLSLILSAKDQLSSVIRSAVGKSEESFRTLEARLDGIANGLEKVGKKTLIAGTALVGAGTLNLKMAADFEAGMANVSTLCDDATDNIKAMGDEVLQIGKRTPVALDQLTSALYDIRSAGIEASDQFKVLEKSAQLGIAGLGSTQEATDLVTSSINAFKLKGEEQNKVYDTIFKTVKYGKTTIAGIAQGFGAVAGTVASAGIKIDDYLASVSALTTTGQPAAVAHHQLKAAIAGMTRESKESKAVLNSLGAKSFKDLISKSGGLVNAFGLITQKVKGNDAAILQLFGSTEAYNAVVGLTTGLNSKYIETLNAMRNGEDALDAAYSKKLNTVNAQMQRAQNLVRKISIDFGSALIPRFTKILDSAERVLSVIDRMPQGLKSAMSVGTVALGAGLVAFGSLNLAVSFGIKQFKDLSIAYRSVSLFMKANPIHPINVRLWSTRRLIYDFNKFKHTISLIPGQLRRTTLGLIAYSKAAIIAMPKNIAISFHNFKQSLIGFPIALKGVIAGFRTLNITMALNPVGLVCAGIAGGAFLIMKYWKPITAFFRGVWSGIIEATRPFHPLFQRIGEAVKPIISWFGKLFKPINTAGKASEEFGKKVGTVIGGIINKVAVCIEKFIALKDIFKKNKGSSIVISAEGTKVDGSHANGLNRVPFDGYIAELHEGERVLTEREAINYGGNNYNNTTPISVTFSDTLYVSSMKDKEELEKFWNMRERRLLETLRTEERRKKARAYA